jgi:FkbM family methyltransferase
MSLNFIFKILPDFLKRKVRSYLWQRLNLHWVLKSGLKVNVSTLSEWWIYNDIYVDGEYDLPIKLMLESSPKNRPLEVIDLGANVGFFTFRVIDLIRQNGQQTIPYRITLVEGSPQIFADLTKRLGSQELLADDIRLVNGLVGKRRGKATLVESEFHIANAISENKKSKGIPVDYVDLHTLFDKNTEIDLLKCDIEGSELHFIENYQDLLKQVKLVVFELHHELCDTAKCLAIMSQLGFQQHSVLRDAGSYSVCLFRKMNA